MAKFEELMMEQINLQASIAADKSKGMNYINKANCCKNDPKESLGK